MVLTLNYYREHNTKSEIERMNQLDALVALNQEKDKAERYCHDLESSLKTKYEFFPFLYFHLNID